MTVPNDPCGPPTPIDSDADRFTAGTASAAEIGLDDPGETYEDLVGSRGGRAFLTSRVWEIAVTFGAVVFYSWGLSQNGYGNLYYAASVRGMNSGLTQFAFASYDQGGWVTVDKPPMSQWMFALSARLFGYSTWSVMLPAVLCGALSVWLLMAVVRRPWGRNVGLVAGIALAITPIMLAVSRSNNPDALLVLWAIATAWAVQRGLSDGRVRWMALAGLFAGFGFLTKSLAIGAVLPGVWLAYLIAAPGPFFRKRAWHCLVGGVVFLAISGGWLAAVQMTPLSARPWIGGSTDGTATNLVFGYNGLGRVTGNAADGGFQAGGGFGQMLMGPDGVDQFGGQTGWGRLFNQGMGDQSMWLAPIVAIAALSAIAIAIRQRRRDERLGSTVMWIGWAALGYVMFAFAKGTFHNYYVSLEVPAFAVLTGIGAQLAVESKRVGRVVAAVALAATAAVQLMLLNRVDAWTSLRVVVPIGVAVIVAAAVTAVWTSARGRVPVGCLLAGLVLLGLAPAAWSIEGVRHPQTGTFPDARPAVGSGNGALEIMNGARMDERMMKWLRDQRHGEKWIVGVPSVMQANQDAIAGDPVVALGGFIGSDGSNSVARIADAIDRGQLRFIIPTGGMMGNPTAAPVSTACTPVDPKIWGGSGGAAALYDCSGKAEALRNAPTTSTLASPEGGFNPGGFPGGAPPGGLPPSGLPQGILPPGVSIPPPGSPLMKFGMCTIQHGGNMQELLNVAGGTTPSPALLEAMNACKDNLPGGVLPAPGSRPGGGGPTPPTRP